jgi:hypothetical protein
MGTTKDTEVTKTVVVVASCSIKFVQGRWSALIPHFRRWRNEMISSEVVAIRFFRATNSDSLVRLRKSSPPSQAAPSACVRTSNRASEGCNPFRVGVSRLVPNPGCAPSGRDPGLSSSTLSGSLSIRVSSVRIRGQIRIGCGRRPRWVFRGSSLHRADDDGVRRSTGSSLSARRRRASPNRRKTRGNLSSAGNPQSDERDGVVSRPRVGYLWATGAGIMLLRLSLYRVGFLEFAAQRSTASRG